MSVQLRSFPELNRMALRVLCRELGIVDTLHYLGQIRSGAGDYTRERKHLFEGLTLDQYREAVDKLEGD